jgi:hypothetical protein
VGLNIIGLSDEPASRGIAGSVSAVQSCSLGNAVIEDVWTKLKELLRAICAVDAGTHVNAADVLL